jgi:hypothetical protein
VALWQGVARLERRGAGKEVAEGCGGRGGPLDARLQKWGLVCIETWLNIHTLLIFAEIIIWIL